MIKHYVPVDQMMYPTPDDSDDGLRGAEGLGSGDRLSGGDDDGLAWLVVFLFFCKMELAFSTGLRGVCSFQPLKYAMRSNMGSISTGVTAFPLP